MPKGARVEEVTRVRRTTRFHSRNLIASAGSWQVPHSPDWALFFPLSHSQALAVSGAPPASIYSPSFKHLLNIRSNSFVDEEDDDGDMQRYKSVVEKSWSKFGELGFKDVESSKLEFDLSEGERNAPKIKRETMDWVRRPLRFRTERKLTSSLASAEHLRRLGLRRTRHLHLGRSYLSPKPQHARQHLARVPASDQRQAARGREGAPRLPIRHDASRGGSRPRR